MEIIREYYEREGCYNFYFKEGNKMLSIIFGGNLDLYWLINELKNDRNLTSEEIRQEMYGESTNTFMITKENYFVYSLFEKLYDDIKESRIFTPLKKENNKEIEIEKENFEILKQYDESYIKEQNEYYKNFKSYQLLFNGDTIEWHSDDDQYERSDILKIKKVADEFVLEFTRPKITAYNYIYRTPGCISIRFRNSGSAYDPFNIIFMRMFNKLQEYDPKYHQIHLEELSYQKKLTLKKQSN